MEHILRMSREFEKIGTCRRKIIALIQTIELS